jgi:hypothetical protein
VITTNISVSTADKFLAATLVKPELTIELELATPVKVIYSVKEIYVGGKKVK